MESRNIEMSAVLSWERALRYELGHLKHALASHNMRQDRREKGLLHQAQLVAELAEHILEMSVQPQDEGK